MKRPLWFGLLHFAFRPALALSLALSLALGAAAGCKKDAQPTESAPTAQADAPAALPPAPPQPAAEPGQAEAPAAKSAKSAKSDRPGAVDGRVVFNGEAPTVEGLELGARNSVIGATAILRRGDEELGRENSDEKGRFQFRELPAGIYTIRVEHPRLQPVEQEVDVQAGAISVLAVGFHAPAE